MSIWNRDLSVLASLIALAALLVVLYVWVWLRTLRAPDAPKWLRLISWLPPVAPIVGFRWGARVASVLWFVVLAAYLVLRSLA